ncbi:MAG: hypothetical protein ACPGUV_11730 [Polyangiales bacterium]
MSPLHPYRQQELLTPSYTVRRLRGVAWARLGIVSRVLIIPCLLLCLCPEAWLRRWLPELGFAMLHVRMMSLIGAGGVMCVLRLHHWRAGTAPHRDYRITPAAFEVWDEGCCQRYPWHEFTCFSLGRHALSIYHCSGRHYSFPTLFLPRDHYRGIVTILRVAGIPQVIAGIPGLHVRPALLFFAAFIGSFLWNYLR